MTTATPEVLAEFLEIEHRSPDLDAILSLRDDALRNYFDDFHREISGSDEYTRDEFPVPVAESGQEMHTGMGHDLIEDAVNHISPEHIQIEVPPRGNRGRSVAERQAKWMRGAWHRMQQEHGPIVRQWIRDAVRYDLGVLKILFTADMWPDRPPVPEEGESNAEYRDKIDEIEDERRIVWPFIPQNVNPADLIWDTSTNGPHWFIQTYEISINEVKARFPDWIPVMNSATQGNIVFTEYWDEQWAAYLVDNDFVMEPREHGYPFPPFIFAEGGQGDLTSRIPKYRYTGMLRYKYQLLDEEARLMSQADTLVRQYSWPSRVFQGDPDEVQTVMNDWDSTPGANNFLPEGVTQSWDIPPGTPTDVQAMLSTVVAKIERGTVPAVASGAFEPNLRSGNTVAIRAGLARLKLDSIAGGVARGIQRANALLLGLVEDVVRGRVTVWGDTAISQFTETLGPRDIRGHRATIVRLSATSPEDQSQRLADAINGKRAGIFSQLEAKTRAGVLNPLEDEEQRFAELILNSPQMLQLIVQSAAQKANLLPQLGVDPQDPASSMTQPGEQQANAGRFVGGQTTAGARGSEQQINSNQRVIPNSLGSLDNLAGSLSSGNPTPIFGGSTGG